LGHWCSQLPVIDACAVTCGVTHGLFFIGFYSTVQHHVSGGTSLTFTLEFEERRSRHE